MEEEGGAVKSQGNILLTAISPYFILVFFNSGKLTEDELEALLNFCPNMLYSYFRKRAKKKEFEDLAKSNDEMPKFFVETRKSLKRSNTAVEELFPLDSVVRGEQPAANHRHHD